MRTPPFDSSSAGIMRSPLIYEWVRSYHGLMLLRGNCSTHCWMSDAASTEWKNYSRPRFNYVAWQPESTPHCVFKSMTLGTLSLSGNAKRRSETSIQVLKSVLRLRISKSLTCDDLNARLTLSSVSVTKPSRRFVFGIGGSRMFGRTFSRSSRSASSSQQWSDDNSDPVRDIRDWVLRVREENR